MGIFLFPKIVLERMRRVSNTRRNLLDEVANRVRDIVKDLDRLINPQPAEKQPVRVPVPVPVRPDRRHSQYPHR